MAASPRPPPIQRRAALTPMPGLYAVSMVPKGWPVPARILLADHVFRVIIDGTLDPLTYTPDQFGELLIDWLTGESSHPFVRLHLYGRAADEADYLWRLALKDWAALHAPDHPCLHPLTRMDPRIHVMEHF